MFFLFLLIVSAYANCDTVVRGNFLAKGNYKLVYEGKLGDMDVVIKETRVDGLTMETRFQTYLSLYSEYKVLQSLEIDYPNHSMKTYAFCQTNDTAFYIMERGERIVQDEAHRAPLRRMIKRNANGLFKILTTDVKWDQLVKKGDEIYTIDVNMGEIYEDFRIDVDKYSRLYIWKLYSSLGDEGTFKPMTIQLSNWYAMKEIFEAEHVKRRFLHYGRLFLAAACAGCGTI